MRPVMLLGRPEMGAGWGQDGRACIFSFSVRERPGGRGRAGRRGGGSGRRVEGGMGRGGGRASGKPLSARG